MSKTNRELTVENMAIQWIFFLGWIDYFLTDERFPGRVTTD